MSRSELVDESYEAGTRHIMQDKDLVSIIVPIYNGEKYIRNIYSNIMYQTYRPIELILVNDGSTDRSKNLLSDIVEMHDCKTLVYMKVLHKENGGIASARNAGLAEAIGKYVMFMDQDDWIEDDCVGALADVAFSQNADIVIGGFNKVKGEGTIEETWSLDSQLPWSVFRITAPWGRLFKKVIIDEKQLSFFDTKISEDLYFNILFLSYSSNVKVSAYVGYNWVQNQDSESHGKWSKMSDDRNPLIMLNELHKQMGNSDLVNKEEMTFFFTKYLVWYLLFCSRGADYSYVEKRSKEIFAWLKMYYPNYSKYAWKSFGFPKGEPFKIRLCVVFVLSMKKIGILPFLLKVYSKL